MINYTFLVLGFLIAFFIIGFSFIELFFPKIAFRIKFPLYILSSIVVSTYVIYLLSFLFGLNRITITIVFAVFCLISIPFFVKRKSEFIQYFKTHAWGCVGTLVTFLIYFIALNNGILNFDKDYYVMSGSNWQDTAMHMSITESLTQGNFPPQAPYYSGTPLNYYYFSDFHSAIISIFYGKYFPKNFVYTNAIFAALLFLAAYSLAFEFSRKKTLSIFSTMLTTFFSGYLFYKFILDTLNNGKIIDLLTTKSYSMEYMGIFGLSNMADYFLQNRPMMVGIPAFILIMTLTLYGYRKEYTNPFILAGVLTGALIKFQLFSIIACVFMFIAVSLVFLKKDNIIRVLKNLTLFFAPILLFYFFFNTRTINSVSFIETLKNNFFFKPWNDTKTIYWHLLFILFNIGAPLIFSIVALFFLRIKKVVFLILLALIYILIPYLMKFTIAEGDMLKFFYFAIVILSLISVYFIATVIKNKFISFFVICVVVFSSTFSSFLTLSNSYLNKNFGYSIGDMKAGLWIRENTPQKSVFVTMPTVHSAPTDIGGRLRIISYINWPYSHGFNYGEDNVFSRVDDVETVYRTADINLVKSKYKANYIFLGQEERGKFPGAESLLDKNVFLKKVYTQEGVSIYEIY